MEDFPRLVSKFKKFFIGLSGGQDSVALLHLLSNLRLNNRERYNFSVEAIHVNHGLQKDATVFQEFCHSLCYKLQVNLHTKCIPDNEHEKKELGIEAFARKHRYVAFSELVTSQDCLVLGHHAEDQVETFLLQWIRGSGINGLSCMARFSEKTVKGRKYAIWRPFLHLSKDSIKKYLEDHNLNWVDDVTNFSYQFDRNRIRNVVVPNILSLREGGMKGMLRSIDNISRAKLVIDAKMMELFESVVSSNSDLLVQNECLNVTVSGVKLLQEPDSLVFELIRFWLRSSGILAPPYARLGEFVRQLRHAEPGSRPELALKGESDSYRMLFYKGRLWLEKK
ncbi:tRNA lysidine(34) synthetase TilS [Betaproteobacteria bacterium]|nr:tRNA lysidine(34) synthetase TilS [Betaproteobacteria bacterium]